MHFPVSPRGTNAAASPITRALCKLSPGLAAVLRREPRRAARFYIRRGYRRAPSLALTAAANCQTVLSKCAGALGCTSHRPPQVDRLVIIKVTYVLNRKLRMRITRFKGPPIQRTTQTTFLLFAFVLAPPTASIFFIFLGNRKKVLS